jgi:uncharacterized tellurite resistance protein B-like protein
MLNKIANFFKSEAESDRTGEHEERELHIAAAAMLIEAAMTDGQVDAVERKRIGVLVERHFGVSRTEVEQILIEGEAKAETAVDIYSFLRVVNDHFNHEERIQLVEMLWDVVYADGVLHDHEANLIRRVSSMLGLTDVESGAARKRVLERRESEDGNGDAIHPRRDSE